mmetsp:Transcript_4787/g.8506  ORF Transcript_4787/g.8506 Transcript_4787/m.8506 type:complete len:463 (+) Transcript_4787:83-1471(+)|eukprot:CAMPEP_0197626114 /NCGR_PEP_ID=MMETSP1338-20131121/5232_1 /TAXON_ID=43686 ORGANISM="Pelagodinium beii, Strain RCC1491" /NCGR_SAMPLE_ID=MMETSP1338 /ASSEMBLY_ACC=CAM_ASM_000754 /LENGTH=462 /DNA_ID=CAMNT_0043196633 /DNA_START=73 /DNA_END=1461 /DNA_ORIENTATION=+
MQRTALSFLASLVANAHIQFRDELPNSLKVPGTEAIGHDNAKGGGSRNVFGEAFQKHGFRWTKALCAEDSDGDNISNGHELGDPCCIWKLGHLPSRTWGISHPGDAHSSTADPLPVSCENWARDLVAEGDAKVDTQEIVKDHKTFKYNEQKGGYVEVIRLSKTRAVKDLKMSVAVLVCFMAILLVDGRWLLLNLWTKQHSIIFALGVLYIDLMSGLLHIVLDNPSNVDLPLLGPAAKGFQHHHRVPRWITTEPWLYYLSQHHPLHAGIMATCICSYRQRPLRIFLLHTGFLAEIMLACHRWAHTHPLDLPWIVSILGEARILLSVSMHSYHHATYDVNFSIFTGWSNPMLNCCVQILPPNSAAWLYIFFGACLAPSAVSMCIECSHRASPPSGRFEADSNHLREGTSSRTASLRSTAAVVQRRLASALFSTKMKVESAEAPTFQQASRSLAARQNAVENLEA